MESKLSRPLERALVSPSSRRLPTNFIYPLILSLLLLLLEGCAHSGAALSPRSDPRAEARSFLELYSSLYVSQVRVNQHYEWLASTDVTDAHDGGRIASSEAYAALVGDKEVIATARRLLSHRDQLEPLQVRQLEVLLLNASNYPGTNQALVRARVEAESRQTSLMDSFQFCLERGKEGACTKKVTANEIDRILEQERDLTKRLEAWNASKEIGRVLKPGLANLRDLRNQVAREMGYNSFYALRIAEYGMTVDEMMTLLEAFVEDVRPSYQLLMQWTGQELARRYSAPPPGETIPAHWAPNRWAQRWVGIVDAVDLEPYFREREPAWIVSQAESFYTSMGFPALPPAFFQGSDLYPVPESETRLKNTHASAWHMDLGMDVRSLMNIESNSRWFSTAHHELGHVYYFMAYSRPEVPPLLRDGANRAFHEAIGELISIASAQLPYLKDRQIVPPEFEPNETQILLNDALEQTLTFLPWAAGTMSRFEYELYEMNLPPEQWQERWWALAKQYQRIEPPSDRFSDPALCDACTKTHINDDPGEYYDYAIATVLKYQLHETIAKKILHQDPRRCNYYGNREVGSFLMKILEQGNTRDWRDVLREATGEDLSTRALLEYFAPLTEWLKTEKK